MLSKRRSGLSIHRKAYSWAKSGSATSAGGTPSGPRIYIVTYNGNLKTSGNVPIDSSSPYSADSTVTVLGNSGSPVLARTGYNFGGWNTAANGSGIGYLQGDTFTISANTPLYAVWDVAIPIPPINLSSVGGNREAYILFTQNESIITNYQYSTDNGATFREFNPPQIYSPVNITTLSSDGVTQLTNGVTYTVKLKAVNSAGISSESASVDVTPEVTSLLSTGRLIYLDANNSSSYSGSGTTWTNLDSGGSYSATLNGAPTFDTTTEAGNKYFDFNRGAAAGQFAQINQAAAINPVLNTPFTIQLWARINNVGSSGTLVSKMFGGEKDYDGYNFVYLSENQLRLHLNAVTQDKRNDSVTGVLTNGWALYTANVQFGNGGGRQNRIFVNGRQVMTVTSNEGAINTLRNDQNLTFPAGFGGDGECEIGQFHYYTAELTTTQIIQNFDATKHRYL